MDVLGQVGAVAGIGGIALVVVVLVFRDVIRRSIFPRLTREQSFRLLMTMVVSISVLAVGGLATYVIVTLADGDNTDPPADRQIPTATTTSTPTPVPTIATPVATATPQASATGSVTTPCEVSGLVVGSDNKPMALVAVGYSKQPDWVFLAATGNDGRFVGSCALGAKDFPLDLEVTTPADKCVRKAQVTLPQPGTYGPLNLRVQTTCVRRIDILADITHEVPGTFKVIR